MSNLAEENLKENNTYLFDVLKRTSIPQIGDCFILTDPFSKKHLLVAEYYSDYDINIGDQIQCRVDKINCDSKVFLEPDHPFYKVGENYEFRFIRFINKLNDYGDQDLVAEVMDKYGNHTHVLMRLTSLSILNPPEKINCRIERIKKGKLYLGDPNINSRYETLKIGESYNFAIVNTFKSSDNVDFFLLKDPWQRKHLLPQKYYTHYKLEVGKTVHCTVIKYSSKGFYLLEPDHPFYKAGNMYRFEIVEVNPDKLIFKDIYGDKIEVNVTTNQQKINFHSGDKIMCMVDKFRKGKPVLVLPEYND